jgi:DNA-binding LacI/PurR family transcriptional regulator
VDIAGAVGVHPSTVSRVLNGNITHSVRPEVIERIMAEASARGYRPNAMARALREQRTGALTFVVPLLRNPIWVRLQRGALLRATERGYVVMIMEEPLEDPQPPGAYNYLVAESRADGLLIATALRDSDGDNASGDSDGASDANGASDADDGAGPDSGDRTSSGGTTGGGTSGGGGALGGAVSITSSPDNSKKRRKGGNGKMPVVPHVYVNRRGPDHGNDVIMDEDAAVRMFAGHVAGLGHRSVLLVDGPRAVDTVHRRVTALGRHCAALGLRSVVRCTEATEKGGFDAIRGLLAGGLQARAELPTAIGIGSIEQVFGVLAALREARVAVPGEVSLVSFDDDESLAYLDVPVTSVRMPLAELGAAAVDALIARIEGETGSSVLIGEPMDLVQRGSVGPPPA